MHTKITERKILTVPAKASVWYMASSVLERGIAMLTTPIFTRLLSPVEYGTVALYTSWMGLFTIFSTLEISGSVVYRGLIEFREERERFISGALGLVLTSGGISALFLLIFGKEISVLMGLDTKMLLLLHAETVFAGVTALRFSVSRFSYHYKNIFGVSLMRSLVSASVSIALIALFHLGAYGKILGTAATASLVALPMLRALKKDKLYSREIWQFILKYNLPLIPNFIALSVLAQSGRIILGRTLGNEVLGTYSVAYSLGFALSLISGGIYSAIVPWIGRKLESGEDEKIRETLGALFSTLTPILLVYLSCVPELFSLLAPNSYRDTVAATYPIAVAVSYSFISNVASSIVGFTGHPYLITLGTVSAAAISVGLNFWLIPIYGSMAAAVTQLISSLILLLFNLYAMLKVAGKKCIQIKNVLKNSLIVLTLGSLNLLFISFPLSRLLLLAAELMLFIPRIAHTLSLIRENQ